MNVFILSALMLSSIGLNMESSIGAAASAMGNIGPALGDFGPTNNYANASIWKMDIKFCMLLGRLKF